VEQATKNPPFGYEAYLEGMETDGLCQFLREGVLYEAYLEGMETMF
jgi:hypothetical protein